MDQIVVWIIILIAIIIFLTALQRLLSKTKLKLKIENAERVNELISSKTALATYLILLSIDLFLTILVCYWVSEITLGSVLFFGMAIFFAVTILIAFLRDYNFYYGLKSGFMLEINDNKLILPYSTKLLFPKNRSIILFDDIEKITLEKRKITQKEYLIIHTRDHRTYHIEKFVVPSIPEIEDKMKINIKKNI